MEETSNTILSIFLLSMALLRIILEVKKRGPAHWPMAQWMQQRGMGESWQNLHRWGLYVSIGYFLLFAPSLLHSLIRSF